VQTTDDTSRTQKEDFEMDQDMMSVTQMTSTNAQWEEELREANTVLDRKIARYNNGMPGVSLFNIGKRAETVEAEIRAEVLATEDLTLKRATRAQAHARAVLRQLAGVDGVRITHAEETRAATLQALVRDDAASLPLAEFATQVRTSMVLGDRPLIYVWLKAARAQVATEETKVGTQVTGELPKLLNQAEDILKDASLDPICEEAKPLAADAGDITRRTNTIRQKRSGRPQLGGGHRFSRSIPWRMMRIASASPECDPTGEVPGVHQYRVSLTPYARARG